MFNKARSDKAEFECPGSAHANVEIRQKHTSEPIARIIILSFTIQFLIQILEISCGNMYRKTIKNM